MRRLYNLLIAAAAPFAFLFVLLRGVRDRGYWAGLGERFGYGRRIRSDRSIWLHAASLGEVSAAAPIVRALALRDSKTQIVVTTATPTGRARARGLFGASADIRFLPYDTRASVARFFGNIQPTLAIVMETELWPNLFGECARRNVPLVLASARLSPKSASRYRRFGSLFNGLFTANVVVAAQTDADAERFRSIGADPARTHTVGNVKFDVEIGADIGARARALRSEYLGQRPVWIAGSTHAGEDESVIDAHRRVRTVLPDALLVLAPRHPNRFDAVAALIGRRGLEFVRRSAAARVPRAAAVLLLDTVGELVMFYASADIGFVGGSLAPIGGHNLLEPAALGLPVLTGPSNFNGSEIAAMLADCGGAITVADGESLAAELIRLFQDPQRRLSLGARGKAAVAERRGSVARLVALIETLDDGPAT